VEPTVFLEYALDIGALARAAGLRMLFITDGYATREAVGLLGGVLDAANVDLKSFDDAFYRKLCGARLAPVLESIEAYFRAGVWLELTTLVIPGANDDEAQLRDLAGWIVERLGPATPWHVSRFHPDHRMRNVPPTPLATLQRAADIGREAGLLHVYVGNAPQLGLEDTQCPGCSRVLVERSGYQVRSRLTLDGACPGCGRPLEGLFADRLAMAPAAGVPA
jgi:pyruvate formate lyase activating enzyme